MKSKLKAIVLKEVKETINLKSYRETLVLYIALIGVTGGIICYGFSSMEKGLLKCAMEINLIMLTGFFIFIFNTPFIKEKFNDEKIIKNFEAILATPTSLSDVWLGKLISIGILSYPIVLISVIVFSLLCFIIAKVNPLTFSPVLWIIALVIAPLLPMMYAALSSWAILRFTHPRLLEVLNLLVVLFAIIIPLGGGQLAVSGTNLNFLNSINIVSMMGLSMVGICIFFVILLTMVKNIKKEKITL